MTVQLRFMTLVVRKDAIANHYPGGIGEFTETFKPIIEDECLCAICSMSGGELGEIVERMRTAGFDTGRFVAIGDMWAGPFEEVPGIVFESIPAGGPLPQWVARCAD